jgi:hypothetical protein
LTESPREKLAPPPPYSTSWTREIPLSPPISAPLPHCTSLSNLPKLGIHLGSPYLWNRSLHLWNWTQNSTCTVI